MFADGNEHKRNVLERIGRGRIIKIAVAMDVAGHCNVEEKYGTFTQYGMNIDSNLSIHPAKLELKEDGA